VDDVLYMGYYSGRGASAGRFRGNSAGSYTTRDGKLLIFGALIPGLPARIFPSLGAPFPYKGLIYVNDVHAGLWIIKLGKPKPYSMTTDPPLQ